MQPSIQRHTESVMSYTEATHTVDGPAPDDADLMSTASAGYSFGPQRHFRPKGITVHYHWRTQLGHTGWEIGSIQTSGPWVTEDGLPGEPGTGALIHRMGNAPQWAQDFATAHFPRHIQLRIDV